MPVFELGESTGSSGDYDGLKEWPIIPEDTMLEVEIVKIATEEKPFKDDEGNPVERVGFEFLITGGEYEKQRIWGDTPTTFTNHPDCKLRSWLQEIVGEELTPKTRVNTDTMLGSRCRVVVGNRSWTDRATGEQKSRHFVKDVLRARSAISVPVLEDSPF